MMCLIQKNYQSLFDSCFLILWERGIPFLICTFIYLDAQYFGMICDTKFNKISVVLKKYRNCVLGIPCY